MQSYKNRFDGKTPEIVLFARLHGILPAQDKYAKGGDLGSFSRFIKDTAGEEIPLLTKTSTSSLEGLADELVAALLRKLINLEADNERLREEHSIAGERKYKEEQVKKVNLAELIKVIA